MTVSIRHKKTGEVVDGVEQSLFGRAGGWKRIHPNGSATTYWAIEWEPVDEPQDERESNP